MSKRERNVKQILTKIMAGFLALLMVGSGFATLLYYIMSEK